MLVTPLPYRPDGADYFEQVADEPWSIFLDSGPPERRQGRWDIIAWAPDATLTARGGLTEIWRSGQTKARTEDPFELLRQELGHSVEASEFPFTGGALGYFGYDLGRRLERLHDPAETGAVPDMAVGIYDGALLLDHERAEAWLVSAASAASVRARVEGLQATHTPRERQPFQALSQQARVGFSPEGYRHAFQRIQAYIRAGDCYQVNLAQSFEAEVTGDPWLAYRQLRQINPAPFAAYLNLPFGQILSSSPERFLAVRAGRVETRPIKGTRARHTDPSADAAEAAELAASAKDRAENLMIVDLLRNDLGKVCIPGSVEAKRLFEVESFASVHHLVSTVTGRLAPGRDALDLLRAAFPGGSITGAPKHRAMQIIDELEPLRRGVYCGSIGYVGRDGGMDCSIAIRTLLIHAGIARFWAGGGIVADSDCQAEYQECLDKAMPMLKLLQPEAPSW